MKYFYENRSHSLYNNIQVSIYENENFNYLAHWHNDAEITYVKEGTINLGVNDKKYSLCEGDMGVFNSGDIHYYESTESPSKIITLIFNSEFIGLPSNWPPKGRFASPYVPRELIENSELANIKSILIKILKENTLKQSYYEFFIKAGLNEICGLLLRNLQLESVKVDPSFTKILTMQKIFAYIEDNYHLDISLKSLATNFNTDRYNLSKDFNLLAGTNLKTYINKLRLFKAEYMILNTNNDITNIALDCGFNTIRSFNRAFKELKGCTPSSLRRE